MSEAICTANPVKMAQLDASTITTADPGTYSFKTEDELTRAEASGNIGIGLIEKLLTEQFLSLGTTAILLTNVDKMGSFSLRDQLDLIERVAQLKGIIHCSFEQDDEEGIRSTPAFLKLSDGSPDAAVKATEIMRYAYEALPEENILVWNAETAEWSDVEEAGESLATAFLGRFGPK